MLDDDNAKHDKGDVEALVNDANVGVATVAANGDPPQENASDTREMNPLPAPTEIESPRDEPTSAGQIFKSVDSDANKNMVEEKSESVAAETSPDNDTIVKDSDVKKVESVADRINPEDHKIDISPKKVQDQLDEVILIMDKFIHSRTHYKKILLTNFFSRDIGSRIA